MFFMQPPLPAPPPLIAAPPTAEKDWPTPPPKPSFGLYPWGGTDIIRNGQVIQWDSSEIYRYNINQYYIVKQPMYIIVDDNKESKMLLNELGRDWSSYDKSLAYLDEIRGDLPIRSLRIIHYTDIRELDKNNIKGEVDTYPAYRFTTAGEMKSFPSTAFACDTWPLLTVESLG